MTDDRSSRGSIFRWQMVAAGQALPYELATHPLLRCPAPMLDAIEAITGHRFRDERLLREALTHSSSADTRLVSNERMEFLGDSILGTVVCEHLYHTYPDLMEGDLTKIKSAVVSRRVCAKVSKATGLDRLLSLGKGMAGRPTIPASVAAAAVESVVAALYLDGGIEPTRRFILEQMHPYIEEAAASAHQQNYKSVLQQLAQRHLPFVPAYVLLDSKGPDQRQGVRGVRRDPRPAFRAGMGELKERG